MIRACFINELKPETTRIRPAAKAGLKIQNEATTAYLKHAPAKPATVSKRVTKGFLFLSMEDESGITNVIVSPDLFERERIVVTRARFLLVEGPLENQNGVIHIRAQRLQPLSDHAIDIRSHDFH